MSPYSAGPWRVAVSGLLVWVIAVTVGAGFYAITLQRTDDQTRLAINTSVCGFRSLLAPQLASYKQAAHDKSLSASARARNDARIKQTEAFLATQITVPPRFDCARITNAHHKP